MGKIKFNASNCFVGLALVLLVTTDITAGKRIFSGSSRKSSSNSGRVTPSYGGGSSSSSNTHGASNSHADVAKLSYPNYNSQPNRPASTGGQQQPPAYGWNTPKQQGPPPAYSANNPAGGAKTNMHEAPPVYHAPSYAAPPPGASYHQPGHLPQGATYYPHAPGSYGGYGGAPGGGYHPAAGGHLPAGGTYLQPGSALPPGAVYYPQAPQSSSGLGFGTGLLAGGLGGALLGHALTPTHTQTVQAAPAAGAADGGHDRIIIINNGQPVNVTDSGSGTTVINAAQAGQTVMPQNATDAAATGAALAPMAANPADAANGTMPVPAEPRIICVPVRVNETDPNDSSKMIEIEKIACYPEPPAPAQQQQEQNQNVPLAPMQPIATDKQHPQDAAVHQANSAPPTLTNDSSLALVGSVLLALYYSCRMH